MESNFKVPIRNLFCMLSYVNDMPEFVQSLNDVDEELITYDFICKQFLEEAQLLIRKGPVKDYVARIETTGRIGGRILMNESMPLYAARAPLMVCEKDEYTSNILLNQIMKSTLRAISWNRYLKEETRRSGFMIAETIPEVDTVPLSTKDFLGVSFYRNNVHYRRMVSIARILHEFTLLSHKHGQWSLFTALLDESSLNRIFEKFLLNFYRIEKHEFHVSSETLQWGLEGNRMLLPTMRTDISLTSKHAPLKIIIDAKFYKSMFQEHYGKVTFHSHNMYQLFTYLMHQPDELYLRGILIYPYNGTHVQEVFRWNDRITMEIMTLNLDASWKDIENSLKDVVG